METTNCSVCIVTYKRNETLKKLLESIEAQNLSKDICVEVIVVDNDVTEGGRQVCEAYMLSTRYQCKYFCQPVKNISLSRNLSVAMASGEFILFVDDDEVASPDWIAELLATAREFDADGVMGPVFPEFANSAPLWIQRRDLYYPEVLQTGDPPYKYTSNCLVKASFLKRIEGPFDVRYGVTGGEDTHMLDRLEMAGARFVFCRSAWVSEYIPPERACVSYLFHKGLKGGNSHSRRVIEFAKRGLSARLALIFKSILYGGTSCVLFLLFVLSRVQRTKWLIKLGSNVGRGMAALGVDYKAYS